MTQKSIVKIGLLMVILATSAAIVGWKVVNQELLQSTLTIEADINQAKEVNSAAQPDPWPEWIFHHWVWKMKVQGKARHNL